jgi:hypothetical protein
MTTTSTATAANAPVDARRAMIINLAVNLLAPAAAFYGLRALGVDQWTALLLAAVPPVLRAVRTVARQRRVDLMAVFTLSLLVLGVAISFVSGSPRFLLAKDGWLTAAVGVAMLATLLGRRPFLYRAIRSLSGGAGQERAEAAWLGSPTYRHMLRALTTMWGVVLVLDAGVRVVLAYALPVDQVPLVSGLQYLGVYAALEITTRRYGRRPARLERIRAESGQDFR